MAPLGASVLPVEKEYPRFSENEIERRRALLAKAMSEADVQHVILYGANRSGSAVQWLTQWPVTREAAVIHTPGERDALLIHFYNHVPNAKRMASDADVMWGGNPTIDVVLEQIRTREIRPDSRIGVIGPLPFSAYQALEESIGNIVDMNDSYVQMRLWKSPEEIEWLRRAAILTDASGEAVRDNARPGNTEHDLVSLVQSAYLPKGGANHIHYFSVTSMRHPHKCVPSQWPTNRRIAAGDVLSFELSTSWGQDYPGQLLRTFTVAADPTPIVRELHDTAETALERIETILKPGTTPEEIVDAAKVIEEAGFTTVDDLVHGFGGGYLPPVFGSKSRTLSPLPELALAEGMTIVVQPNVTTNDGTIGVQTGELFHITSTGAERMHAFPRGLHRIGD